MSQLLECVPNFSEGQNNETIKAIAQSIREVKDVKLLHVDNGIAANRTVYTFVGKPNQVLEAAFQAIKVASKIIDMRKQKGEHPRVGACDVCPLVPISGISMEEVVVLSHQLAERINSELQIPIYLYENSAQTSDRKQLAAIRKGEYEGLKEKMKLADWKPDYGIDFNPKSGATIIGARNFLIAYNFNLNTTDVLIAKEIAASIRESGKIITNIQGNKIRKPGLFNHLKAIGWFIKDFGIAQVSCNFSNYQETPLHEVLEVIEKLAIQKGTKVTGSELIGLIPKQALLESGIYFNATETDEQKLIKVAIDRLGLSDLTDFSPKNRIIDYMV
tara:strand:+ start:5487 stop:6479 length:993 start_codon:yes stop_codon:yes gene_type:complete